ncbi:MAG: DUF192 domain-containing protein [Minisyncoccia bacterium]
MNKKNSKPLIKNIIFSILVVVGFFLIQNYIPKKEIKETNAQYIKIAGQKLKIDLALNQQTQEQGLSGRNSLREDEGMLFVFEKPSHNLFWMKDMNFPIDMIWINEDLHVVYIKKNAKPESFPESFGPDENTKYVLEVVSGFGDKNNLKEGDSVELL